MRRIPLTVLVTITAVALAQLGCTNNNTKPADPFATFQLCFDEHHTTEMFSVPRAIEICCIDHPIGNAAANVVCGATADTCKTYVTANLTPSSASAADVMTGCTDYVHDRGP